MPKHKDVLVHHSHYSPLHCDVGSPEGVVNATIVGQVFVNISVTGEPEPWIAESIGTGGWSRMVRPVKQLPFLIAKTLLGSVLDTATGSIILAKDEVSGVDFGDVMIPDNWSGTQDPQLRFRIHLGDPEAGEARFRMFYFVAKDGGSVWSSGGYTETSAGLISIPNNGQYQTVSHQNLVIPKASVEPGAQIFCHLVRDGDHLDETITKDIRVTSAHLML